MTELLLILLALTLTCLGASLWLWRRSEAQASMWLTKWADAALRASEEKHLNEALRSRAKDKDETIEEIVRFVDRHLGAIGTVDLLNERMLPDGEGGDGATGLPE